MKSDNTKIVGPRILVYQDDNCKILLDYLVSSGFQIITSDERSILDKIENKNFDLCIFSHYKAAHEFARLTPLMALRKSDEKTPVIMLSNRAQPEYIIEAFDSGVDDYIIKPYNMEELIRRIKAVLKRCGTRVRNIEPYYEIGDYKFNTADKILTINSIKIQLTDKQSKVLALLCSYKNEVLSKKILLQRVWGYDDYYSRRSLDVHICTLRSNLKRDSRIEIETIRCIGYSLVIRNEENIM